MPVDDIVVVDLDDGCLKSTKGTIPDDILLIPEKQLARLMSDLLTVDRERVLPYTLPKVIREFFVSMFAGYYEFFSFDSASGKVEFDTEMFLASRVKEQKRFFQGFFESQMFHVWIHEKEAAFQNGSPSQGMFDHEVIAYTQKNPPTYILFPITFSLLFLFISPRKGGEQYTKSDR